MKRLFSLILFLLFSSNAIGAELIQRFENANLYRVDEKTNRLVIGGDVSNAKPFDSDGDYRPQTYRWTDVEQIAPDTYRFKNGRFGYTVNVATSEIRVHPVRKRWDVYYSIANSAPVALDYRQVNDKLLELYKDTPQVRYSFFVGDRGFKINIRLKAGYTGDAYEHTFNAGLHGLARSGRNLIYNGEVVGILPDSWLIDSSSEPIYRDVVESLNGNQLTVSADVTGLTFPVDIDPSVTIQPSSADSFITGALPNSNFGSSTNIAIDTTGPSRGVLRFDISSVSSTATVTNSVLSLYYHTRFTSAVVGQTVDVCKLTETAWTELGVTYNDQVSGVTAWTTPGGTYDCTSKGTSIVPSSFGWMDFNLTTITQEVLSTGQIDIIPKWNNEASGVRYIYWHSRDYAGDTSLRPKLVITYTTVPLTHLGYREIVF